MVKIVGIQLQKNGKIYYFDANNLEIRPGDFVIADTARGYDLGEVAIGMREIDESSLNTPLKKIIRTATAQDIQHGSEIRDKERDAYGICQKKIAEHQLDMKLVSVEYAFDNSKILFYFTANGRVDFRSLVKDLASVFKMRIELRQIGVRDEARILGGLGPCGRPICCGSFLSDFQPVSIKMAKEQNLSLNPTKISGVCGRLMCCLKYEQDHYEQTRRKMPKIGRDVTTPDGVGTVTELNIVKETIKVRIVNGDSSEIKEYPLESITRGQDPCSKKAEHIPDITEEGDSPDSDESAEEIRDLISEELIIDDMESSNTESQEQFRESKKIREKNRMRNTVQLGRPVRRENPKRKKMESEKSAVVPYESSAVSKSPEKKKGKWAEELQKAMDAIN